MASPTKQTPAPNEGLAFEKENYVIMLIGLAFIVIGFLLMSGGGSGDPKIFSEEIFSFRRITLAPIVVMLGFIIEIYAILKKPKAEKQ